MVTTSISEDPTRDGKGLADQTDAKPLGDHINEGSSHVGQESNPGLSFTESPENGDGTSKLQFEFPQVHDPEEIEHEAELRAVLSNVENLPLVATILSFLPAEIKKSLTVRVRYREAVKAGIRFATCNLNRKIYASQVEKLKKSVVAGKFSDAAEVYPMRTVLEELAKNPPEKEIHFFLFDDDSEITLDTPAEILDNCYLVIDGQHRVFACEENEKLDLEIEILQFEDGTDIGKVIMDLNSYDKSWSNRDREAAKIADGTFKSPFYPERDRLMTLLGFTAKTAELVLTFEKDKNTKSKLVKGEDGITYVPGNGERGKDIAYATRARFGEDKAVKKIDFYEAIVAAYKSIDDSAKGSFKDEVKSMIIGFSDKVVGDIKTFIKEKNKGDLEDLVKEMLDSYRSLPAEEKAKNLNVANEKIATMRAELEAKGEKVNTESGTPAALRKARAEAKDAAKAEKGSKSTKTK